MGEYIAFFGEAPLPGGWWEWRVESMATGRIVAEGYATSQDGARSAAEHWARELASTLPSVGGGA